MQQKVTDYCQLQFLGYRNDTTLNSFNSSACKQQNVTIQTSSMSILGSLEISNEGLSA